MTANKSKELRDAFYQKSADIEESPDHDPYQIANKADRYSDAADYLDKRVTRETPQKAKKHNMSLHGEGKPYGQK